MTSQAENEGILMPMPSHSFTVRCRCVLSEIAIVTHLFPATMQQLDGLTSFQSRAVSRI